MAADSQAPRSFYGHGRYLRRVYPFPPIPAACESVLAASGEFELPVSRRHGAERLFRP